MWAVPPFAGHMAQETDAEGPRPLCVRWTNLNGSRDKEVLLLETKLFALVRAVIWVQHTAQCLRTLLGENGLQRAKRSSAMVSVDHGFVLQGSLHFLG